MPELAHLDAMKAWLHAGIVSAGPANLGAGLSVCNGAFSAVDRDVRCGARAACGEGLAAGRGPVAACAGALGAGRDLRI